ncbi:hypothetical protein XENTR_v10021193 [Xenopus tropicalis]|nr:carbohydrate sulfotransferase 4 isoform X2 [Xenopus tropicalis]KAE8585010.1 hypothetical protein XENTR_v10021193 [Xenopus tropicalis]
MLLRLRSLRFFSIVAFIISLLLFIIFPPFHYSMLPLQKRPVHTLIVSSWRSGSSFLGQIFNHHPDVFYIFEPGHPIWMRFQEEKAEVLHYPVRDLMRSFFNCDVSPLYSYLPEGGKNISELKFFPETRALCFPPACSVSYPTEDYDRYQCSLHCGGISLKKMSEACKKYNHIVLKTVRILDLRVLLPLLYDPSLNLRIIHLVRDPRAVASSRRYFSLSIDDNIVVGNKQKGKKYKPSIVQVMSKICSAQVLIYKFARAARGLLDERYMLLRYEDLATQPDLNVREVYRFTGLSFLNSMKIWAYNITHNKVRNDGFMKYSMKSESVVQKWRGTMNFPVVKQIQQVCQEAMTLFGYLPLESETDQMNPFVNIIGERIKDKNQNVEDK